MKTEREKKDNRRRGEWEVEQKAERKLRERGKGGEVNEEEMEKG